MKFLFGYFGSFIALVLIGLICAPKATAIILAGIMLLLGFMIIGFGVLDMHYGDKPSQHELTPRVKL